MASIQRFPSNFFKTHQIYTVSRLLCSSDSSPPKKQASSSKKVNPAANVSEASVSGLSSKVLNVPSTETGPGASKSGAYKNPEYFCYHQASYFEAEIEMANYRLPQPSAK